MVCNSFSLVADLQRLQEAAEARHGQAFRPGTLANQKTHLMLYVAFTIWFGLSDFPAGVRVLLLFGEFLLRTYKAPKAVTNALSSVRGFHLLHGLNTDGSDHYHLTLFKRSLQLTVRHVPTRAPPLPFELLEKLCARAMAGGPLGTVFRALLVVVFFSMGRLSSFAPDGTSFDGSRLPIMGDLRHTGTGFELRLKWGKAQQNAADFIWIPYSPCLGSRACRVLAFEGLLRVLGDHGPGAPLFSFPRGAAEGQRTCRYFTMRLARQWLAWLLRGLGQEGAGYTFHSMRRGACTLAAERGASVADIMQLGGWRSGAVHLYLPTGAARVRAAGHLTRPTLPK